MKDVVFTGSSLDDLRNFPEQVRQRAGFEIDAVQRGLEPTDWKPVRNIGTGVREIRIKFCGQYRVIYITQQKDTVYILHAFQKKPQKISKKDIDLIKTRYQTVFNER